MSLKSIESKVNKIMATTQELIDSLNHADESNKKAFAEITAKINDLQSKVANLGIVVDQSATVTPELEAAVSAVVASSKALDDIVPDNTEALSSAEPVSA